MVFSWYSSCTSGVRKIDSGSYRCCDRHLSPARCNQSGSGIFAHSRLQRGFLKRNFVNPTGTFADQMYAIYAFTMFAQAFQIEEPLDSALRCANSIRGSAGRIGSVVVPLRHYVRAKVVNRYPLSIRPSGRDCARCPSCSGEGNRPELSRLGIQWNVLGRQAR